MEQGRVYISSPVENKMIYLTNNLSDVLGFKQNIIEGKSTDTKSGKERVIFTDYPLGFTSDSCILFLWILCWDMKSV